jgi:hypothetical protein
MKLDQDQMKNLAHILLHLESNRIADENYNGNGGWHCGDKEQFIKRHKKAIKMIHELLNTPINI